MSTAPDHIVPPQVIFIDHLGFQRPVDSMPGMGEGSSISFDRPRVWGSADEPLTGVPLISLLGALPGTVQKLYHQAAQFTVTSPPWILLSGIYVPNQLNVVYIEYVSPTRIEYWVTQEGA